MMSLVIPQDGAEALMGFLARGIALSPLIGLFVNDVVIDTSFVLADLVEATFLGYARQSAGSPVTIAPLPGGGVRCEFNHVFFRATGAGPSQDCFGYFAVQLDWLLVPRLLWAERGSPVTSMPLETVVLQVSPVLDFVTMFS